MNAIQSTSFLVVLGTALCFSCGVEANKKAKVDHAKTKSSGVYGKLVQIGFPPNHPSMGQEVPLPHMLVGVFSTKDEHEIKRAFTDKNGRFKISLRPGTYSVSPIPPDPDPLGFGSINLSNKVVRVRSGTYAETKCIYDAGW